MKILVDGDACPVKKIICQISKQYSLDVIIFISTAHWTRKQEDVEYVTVDSNYQEVDIKLINSVQAGDIVLTNDYGLAALALAKNAKVLSFNAKLFTRDNIEYLLARRHLAAKLRKQREYLSQASKYTNEDREIFQNKLVQIIENIISN